MEDSAPSEDPLATDPSGQRMPDSEKAVSDLPKMIKASHALKQLENYAGTSAAVKAMLADKIRDNAIRAYALCSWTSNEQTLKKAWAAGPPDNALKKQLIDRRHLLASPSWQSDMQRWKWGAGDFFCVLNNGKLMMYKAVQFAAEDIDELRRKARLAQSDIFKSAGGRKPSVARDDVWAWILQRVANDGSQSFIKMRGVVKAIFEELHWGADAPLRDKAVENIVARARAALRDASPMRPSLK